MSINASQRPPFVYLISMDLILFYCELSVCARGILNAKKAPFGGKSFCSIEWHTQRQCKLSASSRTAAKQNEFFCTCTASEHALLEIICCVRALQVLQHESHYVEAAFNYASARKRKTRRRL